VKVTMRVEGSKQLADALNSLTSRVSRGLLAKSLRAGAEPIREAAARFAPRAPGAPDLADHIGVSGARPESGNVAVAIGPTRNFFYGWFQEHGTTRHGAQPFMRPAFDSESPDALRIIRNEVWASLSKRSAKSRGSARTSGSGSSGLL
jgi:HK97 gp10 family phage protein